MSEAARKVIVTEQREVASGERDGREWTLYAVEAKRAEDGLPIAHDLRSFERLPEGEPVDVLVRRHDGTGTWTLKRRTARVSTRELERQLGGLRGCLDDLAARVGRLEAA